MRSFNFFGRFYSAFHDYPSLSKIIAVSTVSGGSLIAYAEANTNNGNRGHVAHADAITSNSIAHADANTSKKKKVVVLGTGWAGISFLKNLNNPTYEVKVVSPRNFFVFTPLLPSVTCGKVEPRSIVEPIRNIIRKKNLDFSYCEAECTRIDPANKKIYCRASRTSINTNSKQGEEFAVSYDYLIIGVGAQVNTFNTPGVEGNCHFLKEIEDAQKIRRNVIESFEKASLPNLTEEERKKILHFVVVGGGPTGVEFSGELHDFVNQDVVKLYPMVQHLVKITVIEATDHVLNMFDKRITKFAESKFLRDDIDVKLGSMVTKISENEISTRAKGSDKTTSMPYGMVLWSTGIGQRPLIREFMKQIGQGNRRALATDEWLRVEGCDNIYALGDCATINQRKVVEDIAEIIKRADKDNSGTLKVKEFRDIMKDIIARYPQVKLYMESKRVRDFVDILTEAKGNAAKETIELSIEEFKSALSVADSKMKNLPATAQVANQQGAYLAKCFNRMEECEKNPEGPPRFRGTGRHRFQPFRYRHLGQFAPLGGEKTAAQLPGDWVSIGHSSQWLWYSIYASKQVSWRTRALVVSDWIRRFIFGRDASGI
ncbi:External alternative NAD(P)H-ubiquinone oxidoreductase B1 [Hibiscus syriacus]|uniref:NADH:ubiquinone reductase (non-electrogenic) n=1 Tax=Hibiscus syriacus TaxID=106335 RepID=A0A6A3CVD6_HIBSY|nr:external alternative NAD(P)H-ubiquinone oxidoreductase B2, mitochondrial-like [Hibiscus syriacus]KAE8732487.1 External alternative NAD(P)H-ubiquinone oxidoreductase B1 [Hibiscus syriacus]